VNFEGRFGDLLTVVTLCAQLTRDLLAIAKFLVFSSNFFCIPWTPRTLTLYYLVAIIVPH